MSEVFRVMRYLIALPNRGWKPSDHGQLVSRVKTLLSGTDARVIEVRISDLRVEVDLRTERVHEVIERLRAIGEVLYHVAVGVDEGDVDPFERALTLYGDRRYWEAHESLEALWRRSSGDEKALLNGLILLAAAHVKLQVGDAEGYFRLLGRALEKLKASGLREYRGLDIREIADQITMTFKEGQAAFGRIGLVRRGSARNTY
ncbi:MAG: DUF309 domain-containing protein [Thaumarchaeota archaeon]|nr:DUF309 domain-containing protein [Candidatus Calditenuaceae archaeon]MDW8041714.1 DUF309 domain-containing protein [Nitrososphaerota archaeon]